MGGGGLLAHSSLNCWTWETKPSGREGNRQRPIKEGGTGRRGAKKVRRNVLGLSLRVEGILVEWRESTFIGCREFLGADCARKATHS